MDQVNIIIYNNIRFLIFFSVKSEFLDRSRANQMKPESCLSSLSGQLRICVRTVFLTSISKATGHKFSMWFTQREFSLKDKITIAWKWTGDFAQVTIGHWDIIMCSMSLFFLLIFFFSLSHCFFCLFHIFLIFSFNWDPNYLLIKV